MELTLPIGNGIVLKQRLQSLIDFGPQQNKLILLSWIADADRYLLVSANNGPLLIGQLNRHATLGKVVERFDYTLPNVVGKAALRDGPNLDVRNGPVKKKVSGRHF